MHEHEARLERLRAARPSRPSTGRPLRLDAVAGEASGRSGGVVLRADELVVGYLVREPGPAPNGPRSAAEPSGAPRTVVVARAPRPLVVRAGERIGIVGPNGAGKTTLLRTIAGELPPLDGRLVLGAGVAVGYLAQIRPPVVPGATVLDTLLAAYPVGPGEARSYLARFLFRGDDVFKAVADLSGGERSRLELALLGVRPASLLLLDEPTNHLDVGAREAIEAFLREAPATILVVSHDRRLLERVCDRIWVVDAGAIVPFDGPYADWRAAVAGGWRASDAAGGLPPAAAHRPAAQGARTAAGPAAEPTLRATPAAGRREPRRPTAAPTPPEPRPTGPAPRLSKDAYRRRRAELDAALEELDTRRTNLLRALDEPAVRSNFVELGRITSELAAVEAELARVEAAWLELEERAP
jgi:ATP-binding cassette subfamily F protein 3